MKKPLHRGVLLGSAFILGAAVMAIELTASRLVAPHFGASMFVWTGLIVTVLLAMSVGYFVGGKAAERGAGHEEAGWCAAMAGAVLFLGSHGIPRFVPTIIDVLTNDSAAAGLIIFVGSLVVSFVAFAIPVFLLAAAGPMLLKAWAAHDDVGAASGTYFALSTVGSVVGTITPTLLLVPAIGASATMDAVSMLLAIVAIALVPRRGKGIIAGAAFAFLGLSALIVPAADASTLEERESPYQLIRIYEKDGTRYLTFNEGAGIQSAYRPDGGPTIPYFDAIGIAPLIHPVGDRPHRSLVLGMAGGAVPRAFTRLSPQGTPFEFTGVEIDPAVTDAARRWLALDEIGATIVEGDARTFLALNDATYDTIVVDAYSVQLYIAPHLATREFFQLVRSRLAPGGVVTLNVNAASPDSPLLTALSNTVAAAFPHVAVMPVPDSWNYIVIASEEPIDPLATADKVPSPHLGIAEALRVAWKTPFDPATEVFTDNHAPVEFMTDAMMLQEYFGN